MRYCTYLADIKLVIISTEGTVNLPGRGRGGWGGALGGLAVIMSWEGDRGLRSTCSSPDFATGHAGGELAVIVSWQRRGGGGMALGGVGSHIVSWEGERGLEWICFGPYFAIGPAMRGWQSLKDLNREGDTDWYPIGSLSGRFGIR
jgi:hypothetical protein